MVPAARPILRVPPADVTAVHGGREVDSATRRSARSRLTSSIVGRSYMETGVAKSESRARGERHARSAMSGFLPWSVTIIHLLRSQPYRAESRGSAYHHPLQYAAPSKIFQDTMR